MNRFGEKEIKDLLEIKSKIVSKCKSSIKDGFCNKEDRCECLILFRYLKELYYSNIPQDYWTLTLDELFVKKIYVRYAKKFIINLDNAIRAGLGIMLLGPQRGIGKTSLMSIIGKEAVMKGINTFYVIAQNIIDSKFSDIDNVLERIEECDLLIIDELDKVVMREGGNIPKILENLLREVLPNKKSILIATNLTEEEVEEKFQIISLLKRYMRIIPMDGIDYSDKLAEKWEERLESKEVNYLSELLKEEAEIYNNIGGKL